ncbi:response regulator [Chryseobacterium suipulveris]|uniref:Response regulator n=1 Tax=Chryseobacterium suipulveris TaxID=2929800 RepID=A0ABY4BT21_9FLAO|nr:response regulator [Chryseobacterium suipulveris]UOE42353.1 response regulator [Chryseobacterium suipulveris]
MKKILIADDEHKIIMTLEYSFRKAGYEVFIARDGAEVLEILKTEIPDLILLDIMMPNVDGYTTLAEIKKNEKLNKVKVIFLSAKTGEEDIKKGLELGADAYVTKPYSIKKLMEKVEELIPLSPKGENNS